MREASTINLNTCPNHSGLGKAIEMLEKDATEQWSQINELKKQYITIMNRMNVILASLVVTCFGLIGNMVVLIIKK
jgi:hypothetical protein